MNFCVNGANTKFTSTNLYFMTNQFMRDPFFIIQSLFICNTMKTMKIDFFR